VPARQEIAPLHYGGYWQNSWPATGTGNYSYVNLTNTSATVTTTYSSNTSNQHWQTTFAPTSMNVQVRQPPAYDFNYQYQQPRTYVSAWDSGWLSGPTPVVETAEDRALRQKANEAAEQLLHDLLGDSRYRVYKRDGHLIVSSRRLQGRLAYQIKAGQKIVLLERKAEGGWRKRKDQLCIHPRDRHPAGDEVAALYLLAHHDEETLWKVANHHDWRQELAA
jgi:hypothetical protein